MYVRCSGSFIKVIEVPTYSPCIRSPAKNPASLEKAGQARLFGFLARLTGKMQPGKAWQACMATAKLSWQPWPPKLGLPGLVTSKAELSRQPWSKKPGLIQALKIQARLGQAFLNFQAKNL